MTEVSTFTPAVIDQTWVTAAEADPEDMMFIEPVDGLQASFTDSNGNILQHA